MPSTPPNADPVATGAFARTTITVVMAVIAALAFVFSFGNVWTLALRLGIPRPIAPLIAPMVDLSVVGLLVALHHLAAHGTDPVHLRSATRLMHLCGLLTVALNTAEPLLARHYGRAALDTVAPALLLGWGAVGPTLLRHLHTPTVTDTTLTSAGRAPDAAVAATVRQPERAQATAPDRQPAPARSRPENAKRAPTGKRTGRPPAATMGQLLAIARPAVAEHGVSLAVVKQAISDTGTPVASSRLTQLMKHLKDEHAPAAEAMEPARTHPADA
ncbi:DUF2637 domain-containing protein [Streptomyces sp. NPDC003300]|uniref:DUF2637 domain-containing protein n=1 Tax=unclassified Streptomyces TaxID=2593676 RepID=UPI0033BD4BC8